MLVLSITLFVFVNVLRWAELADNTSVRTFRDYLNYQNKIIVLITVCWFLITLVVWFCLNFSIILNNNK